MKKLEQQAQEELDIEPEEQSPYILTPTKIYDERLSLQEQKIEVEATIEKLRDELKQNRGSGVSNSGRPRLRGEQEPPRGRAKYSGQIQ